MGIRPKECLLLFSIIMILLFLAVGNYIKANYYKSIQDALVTDLEFIKENSHTREIKLITEKGTFIIPDYVTNFAYSDSESHRMIRILKTDSKYTPGNFNDTIERFLSTEISVNQTEVDIEYLIKKDRKIIKYLNYPIYHSRNTASD
ncbi:hypothetical protein [Desulfofalx alkaliphila]|uniref:hypothetical protein n=1 Tax=Desulfofalx alkaliphila TaxID=105483 RepID=UPI0004E1F3DA|nr:hypothetical protein [Desulfofalx alkaliphila]